MGPIGAWQDRGRGWGVAEINEGRSMEGIWGVADVDADEEEHADEGEDEDEDMDSSSQSSHAPKFEVKGGVPWIIRVSGARDDIINGEYQLLATTRHVAKSPLPAGLVYVCNGGPLDCRSGGDRLNSVCIFCRDGSGHSHRAWWCIGIVPHHCRRRPAAEGGGSDCMDDSNNDGNGGGCLSHNFAMKYIYYWMEVDANDIDGASLLPLAPSLL